MRNRKILFFFLPILSCVVLFTIWWFANLYFVKHLPQQVRQILSDQGVDLDIREHTVQGYPFYVKNIFYDVNFRSKIDSENNFFFSEFYIEELAIFYPIWNPDNLNFSISGSSSFVSKLSNEAFSITQDLLKGKINLDKTKRANLLVKNLQLVGREQQKEKIFSIEKSELLIHQFFLQEDNDTGEHLRVDFKFTLPDHYLFKKVLPNAKIDHFQGQINIKGFFPLEDIAHSIRLWSQKGGFMEFVNISFQSESLKSNLNGSLTLDQNLQPLFVSTLSIKGYRSFFDEIFRNVITSPKTQALINIALNFFSRNDAVDKEDEIQIGITIQDRWLSLGSFRIKKIPPIYW